MRSSCLSILVLLCVLSTNLFNSLHAQNSPTPPSPSPSPSSPAPVPNPNSPSPTPIHSPPSQSPIPHPKAPTPNLSPPPTPGAPTPAPPTIGGGGLSGLTSGQKAGIAIGTIFGGAVLVSLGMIYKKRQKNTSRSRYSNAARNFEL